MRSIASLFGKSPFIPLQAHMEKVAECVGLIPQAIAAYESGDAEAVAGLAKKISRTEFDADQIKDDIRDSLPRGLFMPVDRSNLLNILVIQDSIADRAEDMAVLLTFKQARSFESFKTMFNQFLARCLETFEGARAVIGQLDELLESGFGGTEAARVRELVGHVETLEHECDVLQRELLRELLLHEDELSYGDFFLWTRIIQQISAVADRSENLARAVRTTLETK